MIQRTARQADLATEQERLRDTKTASLGAFLLALSLMGYAIYELVLRPWAGFPSDDMAVIMAGANTLRVGHLLKLGYALSLALLTVGLYERVKRSQPVLAQLMGMAGICAITLFLASSMLGLQILGTAQAQYAVNPDEARMVVLQRTVTVALLQAATHAVGWFGLLLGLAHGATGRLARLFNGAAIVLGALFVVDFVAPESITLVAPLLTIAWAIGFGWWLWVNEQ